MSVPSYPFHFLSLKLSNKEMDFPFPLLKLPNKRREEYYKIIFLFHSILSSQAESKWVNGFSFSMIKGHLLTNEYENLFLMYFARYLKQYIISTLITAIKKNKRVSLLFNVGVNIPLTSYLLY